MIAIIDYGLGNIKAFVNVFNKLNIPVTIANVAKDLDKADKIIMPGVGAFDFAMQRLESSGMRKSLDRLVMQEQVPILGVCVGMQMLACKSEEGILPGLGWISGEVKKFNPSVLKNDTLLPHMGWNDVIPVDRVGLFNNIDLDSRFYFLHSYYFDSYSRENVLATTDYGVNFDCAVNSKNIFGVQFHPEKSHQWGIQLLKNFAEL